MSVAVTPLVDLPDIREHLNIDDSDTAHDAELMSFVLAATEIINSKCGYTAATPVTETMFVRGDAFSKARLILSHTPVLSMESIVPIQIGLPTPDMTQVAFDPITGIVYWTNWMVFYGSFTVSYTAGRDTVPDALQLACKIIVQDMWDTQRGADPLPASGGEDYSPTNADGIPFRALQLMRISPYWSAPGIA